jgi:hypothetical protein
VNLNVGLDNLNVEVIVGGMKFVIIAVLALGGIAGGTLVSCAQQHASKLSSATANSILDEALGK